MNKPVPAGLANLADFRPASVAVVEDTPLPVRAVAEAHGFVERNPVAARKRKRGTDEPMCSFTARVTVRSANAFVEFCERERLSYREGFDRLVSSLERSGP